MSDLREQVRKRYAAAANAVEGRATLVAEEDRCRT
jgi:hypothetical protein